MLTISAGRIAKAALLHLPEGPADPPADHPSVLLEGKKHPLHPAVGLALATDRLDGGALASAERLQVLRMSKPSTLLKPLPAERL